MGLLEMGSLVASTPSKNQRDSHGRQRSSLPHPGCRHCWQQRELSAAQESILSSCEATYRRVRLALTPTSCPPPSRGRKNVAVRDVPLPRWEGVKRSVTPAVRGVRFSAWKGLKPLPASRQEESIVSSREVTYRRVRLAFAASAALRYGPRVTQHACHGIATLLPKQLDTALPPCCHSIAKRNAPRCDA
jgi:hypothetical protein